MITYDEAVRIVETRRAANSRIIQMMIDVQSRYGADIAIPLPEMDTNPIMPSLTPSLVAQTIDHHAIRAASTVPSVNVPALDMTKDMGVRSKEWARIRQKAIYSTWHRNKLPLGLRRIYRHLTGYASAVILVTPDYHDSYPCIEIRSPLGSYPCPKAPEDLSPVEDCGFVLERSAVYLRDRFPNAMRENGGPVGVPGSEDETWEVLEWHDADQMMIGIIGPKDQYIHSALDVRRGDVQPSIMLRRYKNHLGRTAIVSMPRVTLDRIVSQISLQIPTIDLQAKMLALAIVAEERAVFPDRWVVGRQGETPRIVSHGGNWVDGRTGGTNVMDGVSAVGQLDSAPPDSTGRTIDRLERNYRVSVGDVPAFGGETYGALRTGRGIDSMLGASVDPMVQELQDIVAYGLSHVNELILDTWKVCFGQDVDGSRRTFELFSGWGGTADTFEFTPQTHVENDHNSVSYAIAGADVQGVTIQIGQLLGTELISASSARQAHPWIADPEFEEKQLNLERLNNAAWQAIGQQLIGGGVDFMLVPIMDKYLKDGMGVAEALGKAQEEFQTLQATAAADVTEDPALAADPASMLGLAAGAGGAAQPPPELAAQIAPSQGQEGLSDLFAALRASPTG